MYAPVQSRAAHDENLALLHLIEMLNIVKGCITLNRNSLPASRPAEPVVPAAVAGQPAAQPSSRQPSRGRAPPVNNSSTGFEAYQDPPSPTLIAPQLTSHDSIVADAEQDPSCLSPAGKHKQRSAVPTASQLLSARQLLDAHQQRASQQQRSAAQSLFPRLSHGLLGEAFPHHRLHGGPQPQQPQPHLHNPATAACHGKLACWQTSNLLVILADNASLSLQTNPVRIFYRSIQQHVRCITEAWSHMIQTPCLVGSVSWVLAVVSCPHA